MIVSPKSFIEHCFTDEEMKKILQDNSDSLIEKNSFCIVDKVVYNNTAYSKVLNRCFDMIDDQSTYQTVDRVLSGHDQSDNIDTLDRLGWWNPKSKGIISDFLYNHMLSSFKTQNAMLRRDRYMNSSRLYAQNVEDVILAGFDLMEASDLTGLQGTISIENPSSFNWAKRALSIYRNAYLRCQDNLKNKGYVDYYLNGFADTAIIEFIHNGYKASDNTQEPQSADINAHLERLTTKYHSKRFALVNFNMKGATLILPSDPAYHHMLYTYINSTNTLYRGEIPIKAPAVLALPSPKPLVLPTSTSVEVL